MAHSAALNSSQPASTRRRGATSMTSRNAAIDADTRPASTLQPATAITGQRAARAQWGGLSSEIGRAVRRLAVCLPLTCATPVRRKEAYGPGMDELLSTREVAWVLGRS